MTPVLQFKGYRIIEASADNFWRLKWNKVSSSLDVLSQPCALTLHAVGFMNENFNQSIVYIKERGDNWQTPNETLDRGSGDCEDFAILKYAVLLKSGLPPDAVRIVVGHIASLEGESGHAWCAAYLDHEWRVLDNMFNHLIVPHDYINWVPAAAMHGEHCDLYLREFSINEVLAKEA